MRKGKQDLDVFSIPILLLGAKCFSGLCALLFLFYLLFLLSLSLVHIVLSCAAYLFLFPEYFAG